MYITAGGMHNYVTAKRYVTDERYASPTKLGQQLLFDDYKVKMTRKSGKNQKENSR